MYLGDREDSRSMMLGRAFSVFCPRGSKMSVWIFWGAGTYLWASMRQTRGICRLILDLLLDVIWWNLGLFSHKRNIVSLKPLYN